MIAELKGMLYAGNPQVWFEEGIIVPAVTQMCGERLSIKKLVRMTMYLTVAISTCFCRGAVIPDVLVDIDPNGGSGAVDIRKDTPAFTGYAQYFVYFSNASASWLGDIRVTIDDYSGNPYTGNYLSSSLGTSAHFCTSYRISGSARSVRLYVYGSCINANTTGNARSIKCYIVEKDIKNGDSSPYRTVTYEFLIQQRAASGGSSSGGNAKYALCVGINKYTLAGCYDLYGCVNDAAYFRDNLVNRGGWTSSNVTKLTDSDATKTAIRAAIQNYAAKAVSGDIFIYQHSSHGGSAADSSGNYTKDVCLCTYNAEYWDYELASDLAKFVSGVKVVVIADTCHSGGLFKGMGKNMGKGFSFDIASRVTTLINSQREKETRVVAKASTKGISASEIGWATAAEYDKTSSDGACYDSTAWMQNFSAYNYGAPHGGLRSGGAFTAALTWGWWTGQADSTSSSAGNGSGSMDAYEGFSYAKSVLNDIGLNPPVCLNSSVLRDVVLGPNGGYPTSPDLSVRDWTSSGSGSTITLEWSGAKNATSYKVYRSITPRNRSSPPVATGLTSATYTDNSSDLSSGSRYYYWVEAVNSGGSAFSGADYGYVGNSVVSLSTALDNTSLSFSSGGGKPWWGLNGGISHDGTDSAHSGKIGDKQDSWMATTVSGAGTLTFWWKSSCETPWQDNDGWHVADYLEVLVDGTQKKLIYGETDWEKVSFSITDSGNHTVKWNYHKDSSNLEGADCGWVDEVTWSASGSVNPSRPDNDDFSNAKQISGSSGSVSGTTVGATAQSGEPLPQYKSAATNTIWYVWSAPESGSYTFHTTNTTFDTVMGVYTGTSVSSLSVIKESDDDGPNQTSLCTFSAVYGTTYRIAVSGYGSRQGTIRLGWKKDATTVNRTVSFYSGGGSGSMSSQMVPNGIATNLKKCTFTKTGHSFKQWSGGDGNIYRDQQQVTLYADLALTAQWTGNVYRVNFNVNGDGGMVSPTYKYVTYGSTYGSLPTPTRTGSGSTTYTFDGWYTSGGSKITSTTTVAINSTQTLYAHWTETQVLSLQSALDNTTLTFKTGGTSSWVGQTGQTHDGLDAVKSGYLSACQTNWLQTTVSGPGTISFWWYVSSETNFDFLEFLVDGSVIWSLSGTNNVWTSRSYSISASGTHILQWRYGKDSSVDRGLDAGFVDQVTWTPQQTYTVTCIFDSLEGRFSDGATRRTVEVTPGKLWGKMPMPAMSGYVFDGWYTGASGGTMITASSTVPASTSTYYAHWTKRLGLAAASEWGGAFETDSWCGQGTVAHDGKDALRSGIIYDGQSSYLITRVTGPGTLTFWWAVSCEGGGKDALRLLVDGRQIDMISGNVDWTPVAVEIPGAGTHLIKWNYTKNGSVTKGEDFGWVDQIAWAATPTESAFVFDANGGKFSNGASTKKTYATPGNLWGKMYMPTKDGQVFVGWYTAKEGGTLVTSSSTVPNAYTTYYARWTPRLGLAAASEWSGAFETDSWCGQGTVSHDGKDALRSGIIYNDQSSYILTRVNGSGTFTFWWKVSCEGGGYDKLRFVVDGVQKGAITGETDWTKVTVDVTGSGTHVLKWVYAKDGSATKGQDFGWIDQMTWITNSGVDTHNKVQLWEGGPYWATTNIGADEPWEYGYYFWWGDTVGYMRENDAWVASDGSSSNFSFSSGNTPTYYKDIATLKSQGWITADEVLAPEHDAAHVQWGGSWRMPTEQELVDLCYNKCDWTWTTVNGVNGYIVRGRGSYASNSIFLPCAGVGHGTSLGNAGSSGDYWSSVPDSDDYDALELYFNSCGLDTDDYGRFYGRSVRPVQGFTK